MKQAYEKAMARVVLFDNSDVITTSGVFDGGGEIENSETGYCPGNGNWIKEQRECNGSGNYVGYHCPHGGSKSKK